MGNKTISKIIAFLKMGMYLFNPLSANPEKRSNTLKQIVGNLPTICLSVFHHFMNVALKGLMFLTSLKTTILLLSRRFK